MVTILQKKLQFISMNTRLVLGIGLLSLVACTPMQPDFLERNTESGTTMMDVVPSKNDVTVSTGTLLLGKEDAPVTLLLFTNYDCAYCHDFEYTLMPQVQTEFIRTGDINVQIIPVPLQKYAESDRKMRLLLCGVKTGSGNSVHSQLFARETNFPTLETCLENEEYLQQEITSQYSLIQTFNITLVPSYVINGETFTGLPSYPDLRGQIRNALNKAQ